ncbi:hypothetical protein, partial [Morganella morganii]|uniref:hypothetical protein n=1 Tax=Morganella morganii TaxID=582 RepID=UPI001C834520
LNIHRPKNKTAHTHPLSNIVIAFFMALHTHNEQHRPAGNPAEAYSNSGVNTDNNPPTEQ